MIEELYTILGLVAYGIAFGYAFLFFRMLWRLITRKPVFAKSKYLRTRESSKRYYTGIIFFGVFAICSFFDGKPIFALFFLFIMFWCIRALILYKRNKRK